MYKGKLSDYIISNLQKLIYLDAHPPKVSTTTE